MQIINNSLQTRVYRDMWSETVKEGCDVINVNSQVIEFDHSDVRFGFYKALVYLCWQRGKNFTSINCCSIYWSGAILKPVKGGTHTHTPTHTHSHIHSHLSLLLCLWKNQQDVCVAGGSLVVPGQMRTDEDSIYGHVSGREPVCGVCVCIGSAALPVCVSHTSTSDQREADVPADIKQTHRCLKPSRKGHVSGTCSTSST